MFVNHPPLSPKPFASNSISRDSSSFNGYVPVLTQKSNIGCVNNIQAWSSPAFLQRNHPLGLEYDIFLDEDDFLDNARRKKSRFGRGSGQWRFAEPTPSPIKELAEATIAHDTPSKQQQTINLDFGLLQDRRLADISIEHDETLLEESSRTDTPLNQFSIYPKESSPFTSLVIRERQDVETLVDKDGQASTHSDRVNKSNGAISAPQTNTSTIKPLTKGQIEREVLEEEFLAVKGSLQSANKVAPSSPASVMSIGSSSLSSSDSKELGDDDEVASITPEAQINTAQVHSHDFGLDGSIFSRSRRASDQPIDHGQGATSTSGGDGPDEESSLEAIETAKDDNTIHSEVTEAHDEKSKASPIATEKSQSTGLATSDVLIPSSKRLESIKQPSIATLSDQQPPDKSHAIEDVTDGAQSPLDSDEIRSDLIIRNSSVVKQKRSPWLPYTASDIELSKDRSEKNYKTRVPEQKSSVDTAGLESDEEARQQAPQSMYPESVPLHPGIANGPELLDKQDHNKILAVRQEDVESAHSIGEKEMAIRNTGPNSLSAGKIWNDQIIMSDNVLDEPNPEGGLDNIASTQESHSQRDLINDEEGPSIRNNPLRGQGSSLYFLSANEAERFIELPSTVPDSAAPPPLGQLLTPSTTQRTNLTSQPSIVLLKSIPGEDTLPTPRLTQGTSTANTALSSPLSPASTEALLTQDHRTEEDVQRPKSLVSDSYTGSPPCPPTTPVKPRSTLVERLKAIRKTRQSSPSVRLRNSIDPASPWFASKTSSHVIPDSETESGISEFEDKVEQIRLTKAPGVPTTPDKPLATMLVRSSPAEPDNVSAASSPYVPPSQPAVGGLRTNLSYFVPLAALPSHFGTQTDTLAVAVGATSTKRASSGPRDFMQSLYISDYSISSSKSVLTTAQIFRPSKACFPQIQPGDAILLRNFKVQSFQRRLSLLSTEISAWAVFHEGSEPQIRGPPVELGAEERAFARGHWKWWGSLSHDERERLQAAIPEEKSQEVIGKVKIKVKKEGINGIGVELPGSQKAKPMVKKEDQLSTQALAMEWSTGLHRIDSQSDEKDSSVAGRGGLRPRNAKGKTVSPEKEDPPAKKWERAVKRGLKG